MSYNSWYTSIANKVNESVSTVVKNEIFESLTLNSPEFIAEREQIEKEETYKEQMMNMNNKNKKGSSISSLSDNALSYMYCWDTNDLDRRDILVDECKEMVLKLSHSKETFFGPYKIPPNPIKLHRDSRKNNGTEVEEIEFISPTTSDGDEDVAALTKGNEKDNDEITNNVVDSQTENEENVDGSNDGNTNVTKKNLFDGPIDMEPSTESLQKLQNLVPLPELLEHFQLYSHLPMIQRMLQCDKQLVIMQSKYSGGGEREIIFWKNYFFHCAYTRYEAGLSIDEIWSPTSSSSSPRSINQQQTNVAAATGTIDPENTTVDTNVGSQQEGVEPDGEDETNVTNVASAVAASMFSYAFNTVTAVSSTVTNTIALNANNLATVMASSEEVNTDETEGNQFESQVTIPMQQQQQQQNYSNEIQATTTPSSPSLSKYEVIDHDRNHPNLNEMENVQDTTGSATTVKTNEGGDNVKQLNTENLVVDDLKDDENENIQDNDVDDDDDLNNFDLDDYEFDELEAEIARELND